METNPFKERQEALNAIQKKWFFAVIIIAFLFILSSIFIVYSMAGFLGNPSPLNLNQLTALIAINLIKTGVLFPIGYIFHLIFIQYQKERKTEENYAHKVAVISLLKDYKELDGNDEMKEKILSRIYDAVCSSPTSQDSTTHNDYDAE